MHQRAKDKPSTTHMPKTRQTSSSTHLAPTTKITQKEKICLTEARLQVKSVDIKPITKRRQAGQQTHRHKRHNQTHKHKEHNQNTSTTTQTTKNKQNKLYLPSGILNKGRAKAGSTRRCSQAVPHLSTSQALCRLTSGVKKDPVHSTRYGRQRQHKNQFDISNPRSLLQEPCQWPAKQ